MGHFLNVDDLERRFEYYQDVHIWPRMAEFDYKGWIGNFSSAKDKEVGYALLDFFVYYSREMTNQLLQYSVSQVGSYLESSFPNWSHQSFREKCYFSYIPGETHNPSDSGHRYIGKIRDLLRLSDNNLFYFKDIEEVLNRDNACPKAVIFVDDFIGSGNQCISAWYHHDPQFPKPLEYISRNSEHRFAYAAVCANIKGYSSIKKYCPTLFLSTPHILDESYNIFNRKCPCWKKNESFYHYAMKRIIDISKSLSIPFTKGKSTVDVLGYRRQGLAVAIEESPPDAVPALFYWDINWNPLMKRNYGRDSFI